MPVSAWIAVAVVGLVALTSMAWRWASRMRSLPCPSLLAWTLDSPLLQRLNGTRVTIERLALKPGQRILEIGPGPGRLLIPAAKRILPGGEAVGIEIQQGMVERLNRNLAQANVTNVTTILGDATTLLLHSAHFDLVFLCTALGEVPDRQAVLEECHRVLKSGGMLSITEMFGDPHYQSQATVRHFAEQSGFRLVAVRGRWWLYTASFVKP